MNWNPIWWVHLQMTGGWRGAGLLAAGFFGVVIFFYVLTQNWVDPDSRGQLDYVWLGIVSLAQAAFLLLVGPGGIRRSLQRDFQSGMVESHRLTPMSNAKIILGYMTGPTFQALLLFSVGLILGSIFATRSIAQLQVGMKLTAMLLMGGWYTAMGTLLAVALMSWAFVLLMGIATTGKTNVIGLFIAIGFFGGWAVVTFVPGLSLLIGVMSLGSLYSMLTRPGSVAMSPQMIALTGGIQLMFAAIFLNAACTKFRRPEKSLFSVTQALVLQLAWGFTLIAGISQMSVVLWFMSEEANALQKIYASVGTFLTVAVFVTHAAALEVMGADRAAAHREAYPASQTRLRFSVPAILALLTVFVYREMLRWVPADAINTNVVLAIEDWSREAVLFLVFLLAYAVDFAWLYMMAARGRKAWMALLLIVVLLRVGPLIVDGAIYGIVTENESEPWPHWGYISGLSPAGTMLLGHPVGLRVWGGVAFQGAVFAVSMWLLGRSRRRVREKVITAAAAPSIA